MPTEVPVLIVGGSLNGLTAALCLAHHGIKSLVVERQSSTTVQYKFRGISPRSMEIFRSLGIEPDIRQRDTHGQSFGIARAKNLSDPNVHWEGPAWPDTSDLSPTPPATCDQDRLEPILRMHAEKLGADIRFSTELTGIEQDGNGIRARVRDLATGAGADHRGCLHDCRRWRRRVNAGEARRFPPWRGRASALDEPHLRDRPETVSRRQALHVLLCDRHQRQHPATR